MIKTQDEIRKEVQRLLPNQKDVAEELRIEPTYFSKWMNSKVKLGSDKLDRVVGWINARS